MVATHWVYLVLSELGWAIQMNVHRVTLNVLIGYFQSPFFATMVWTQSVNPSLFNIRFEVEIVNVLSVPSPCMSALYTQNSCSAIVCNAD